MKLILAIAALAALRAVEGDMLYPGEIVLESVSKYPGYTGDILVEVDEDDVLVLSFPAGKVMIEGTLIGLPVSAEGGIHIHAGSSCDAAGPHHLEGPGGDPGVASQGASAGHGGAARSVSVDAGSVSYSPLPPPTDYSAVISVGVALL